MKNLGSDQPLRSVDIFFYFFYFFKQMSIKRNRRLDSVTSPTVRQTAGFGHVQCRISIINIFVRICDNLSSELLSFKWPWSFPIVTPAGITFLFQVVLLRMLLSVQLKPRSFCGSPSGLGNPLCALTPYTAEEQTSSDSALPAIFFCQPWPGSFLQREIPVLSGGILIALAEKFPSTLKLL